MAEVVFGLAGLAKWIYDTCTKDAETEKLIAKAEKLEKKWKSMDHRTSESKKIHEQLAIAKAFIKANKASHANGILDGILSVIGLA